MSLVRSGAGHGDAPRCPRRIHGGNHRGGGPPAYPGVIGYEPDLTLARDNARRIAHAMSEIRKASPAGWRRALRRPALKPVRSA
jgi:hypothetical protein